MAKKIWIHIDTRDREGAALVAGTLQCQVAGRAHHAAGPDARLQGRRGSKGGGLDGRGSDEAAFVRIANEACDLFLKALASEVIKTSSHRARQLGLE